ncbi:MAG: transglycosylase SLT domain-containing protein [Tannerellaceae bacterium]|nr:transglycosylase SLT domain-containing protein [Tannerellaceae bacterium]
MRRCFNKKYRLSFALPLGGWGVLFLILLGCKSATTQTTEEEYDLSQIIESGELRAVTLYSSTSYFEYRSEAMGYEYDLIKNFAKSLGLTLNLVVAENELRLVEMLQAGEVDIVAYPIPMDNRLKQEVIYCGPEDISTQVLVQRAARGDTILFNVTELIGREVYVKPDTKYHQRLVNLDNELGGGIIIKGVEKDTVTTEDLIEMVSRGEIPYTVSDDRIARLNKTYYWNIDIQLQISFPQRSMWVVRNDTPLLAEAINLWNAEKKSSVAFTAITKRYFELSKRNIEEGMPVIQDGNLSPYDNLFKQHARAIDWDWQLLAALAYQESKFQLHLESWAGAKGLMGIMPATARAFGVHPHELEDPDIAIRTGVECLKRFGAGFRSIPDPVERIKFTLASYNAGVGHIYDAQRLAEKYGKNPQVWDEHVAEFIRLKAEPQYYNDPLCKHGYLRGKETYNYVREVMDRYNYYMRRTS